MTVHHVTFDSPWYTRGRVTAPRRSVAQVDATGPQKSYIRGLASSRVLADDVRARLLAQLDTMSKATAHKSIDWLLSQPEVVVAPVAPKAPSPEVTEGVYHLPSGELVKVSKVTRGPRVGRLTTHVWTSFGGTRLTEHSEVVDAHWVWAPRWRELREGGVKLTLAEATKYTEVYGRCIRCSTPLKAAQSVKDGIGPVCITYFQ
jgi:hypothetical protein